MSTSPDPSPNQNELIAKDATLYGFGIAIFSAILGAGLVGFYEKSALLGTIFTLISAIGFIVMFVFWKGYRPTLMHALTASNVILIAICASLGYLLWPKPTIYVNPLHTEATKWNMARSLQWWRISTSPQHPNCQIAIVRYPETYSQDYASDFKEILDVAGWKYTPDHIVVDGTLQNGITIRGNHDDHLSKTCAEELDSRIQNDGRSRSGMGTYLEWPSPADLSDFLKQCQHDVGCVEVTFGNEDTTR